MINVEVKRQHNENTANLIRRFSKRVQGSGILHRARKLRYRSRPLSLLVRKKKTLATLKRRKEREKLIKLGKIQEKVSHR